MPLRKALGYSRNIPAVKMYFSVGEEKALKPFLKDLGISTLIDNHEYGYPLALGA
jgi:membrane peptidoglycan carboxypeptidase